MTGADLVAALEDLLRANGWVAPSVSIDQQASGGAQRETFFITIADGDRRQRAVAQVSSSVVSTAPASAEAALLSLAAGAGVRVPEVLAYTDSLGEGGVPGLIVTFVEGLAIPRQVLRSLDDDAGDAVARQCGESLARLHSIDESSAPVALERPAGDVYADYCAALSDALEELPDPHPALRLGIKWLDAHRPAPVGAMSVVHGDFRTGNLLVDEGSLAAVLDWELAHVGDPMEDLAYLCMRTWRFGADHRPAGGFGSMDALRGGYEAGGGTWRDDAFEWWTVARTVWWATGLAAQAAAFSAGLTDSIVLAASGRRVVELEYDLLRLIG